MGGNGGEGDRKGGGEGRGGEGEKGEKRAGGGKEYSGTGVGWFLIKQEGDWCTIKNGEDVGIAVRGGERSAPPDLVSHTLTSLALQ